MTAALPVTGNTEHTRPENRAFYPALDGLRTFAFLLVFFHHYTPYLPWGWAGVDLFFVLSGFLITGILFDTKNDAHCARNFYIRRMLRLFPLYYLVLFALVLLWPLAHWHWNWRWVVWPLYLGNWVRVVPYAAAGSPLQELADFYLYGSVHGHPLLLYFGHLWSLCVEEQFYLVWPWVVFLAPSRRALSWICVLAIPLSLAARLLGQHYFPPWMIEHDVLFRLTPFRLDDLLAGGLLALLMRGRYRMPILKTARWAAPVAFVLVVAGLVFTLPGDRGLWYPVWTKTYGLTAIEFLCVLLIAGALEQASLFSRAFSWAPLRWAGRISYGAYIFHDIPHNLYVFGGQKLHLNTQYQIPLLALAGTYFAAWISFRYIETPFLNLKDRWTIRTSADMPAHAPSLQRRSS